MPRQGPLAGLRVLEFAGIGPAPFCAMLLADLGAEVLLIDRPDDPGMGVARSRRHDLLLRGRQSLILDLKQESDALRARQLSRHADALIEGFRPGVMERLGLGPEVLARDNPRLVYGRMTGWGQHGPRAGEAGHDLNYIAHAGLLAAMGRPDAPPPPPLNVIGDFGGGGMLLAVGVLAALLEARTSGRGQVVDAAMVDGSALLANMFHGLRAEGRWHAARGSNFLDGGAPFYDTYATADGRFVAVAALEEKFYRALLAGLAIEPGELPARDDPANWPQLRARFAAAFATRTRDDWAERFAGSDACVTPVLCWDEVARDAHNCARHAYVRVDGVAQPAPAPRFSRTPGAIANPPPMRGEGGEAMAVRWAATSADRPAPAHPHHTLK
jgi:alpha-methylacyl-CoA racemase